MMVLPAIFLGDVKPRPTRMELPTAFTVAKSSTNGMANGGPGMPIWFHIHNRNGHLPDRMVHLAVKLPEKQRRQ